MIRVNRNGHALVAASLAFLLSACSDGVNANGDGGVQTIIPARTDEVPHFPLPLEYFSPLFQEWDFDYDDTNGGVQGEGSSAIVDGRNADERNNQTNLFNMPGTVQNQYRRMQANAQDPSIYEPVLPDPTTWSHPVTNPMPLTTATFVFRQDTDVWVTQGTEDREAPNPTNYDENQFWDATPHPFRAGMMCFACQWFILTVDGDVRTDETISYDGNLYTSLPISIIGWNHTEVPSPAPPRGAPAGSAGPSQGMTALPLPAGAEGFVFEHASQSKVDSRIVYIDPSSNDTAPEGQVGTFNESAIGPVLQIRISGTDKIGMNAHSDPTVACDNIAFNCIEYASDAGGAPPPILWATWQEQAQENLFIEGNCDDGTNGEYLRNVPTSAYFSASGRLTLPGGLYVNKIPPGADSTYGPLIDFTDANIRHLHYKYFGGVILAHVIGRGIGVPDEVFARPGLSDREETLANVNIQYDAGLAFLVAGCRRCQWATEQLRVMMDTTRMPLGGVIREAFDEGFETADPDDDPPLNQLDEQAAVFMHETLPGPYRMFPD